MFVVCSFIFISLKTLSQSCASPLARTARRERESSCILSLRICPRLPFLWISYSIQHNIQQIGDWVKNLLCFCLRACSPWLSLLYYPVLRLLARPGTWTLCSTYSVLHAARKLLLMVSESHKYQRMSLGPEESARYFVSIVYLALRLAQDISNSLGINFHSIFTSWFSLSSHKFSKRLRDYRWIPTMGSGSQTWVLTMFLIPEPSLQHPLIYNLQCPRGQTVL